VGFSTIAIDHAVSGIPRVIAAKGGALSPAPAQSARHSPEVAHACSRGGSPGCSCLRDRWVDGDELLCGEFALA